MNTPPVVVQLGSLKSITQTNHIFSFFFKKKDNSSKSISVNLSPIRTIRAIEACLNLINNVEDSLLAFRRDRDDRKASYFGYSITDLLLQSFGNALLYLFRDQVHFIDNDLPI